jgi:hypothetical protein
LLQVFLYAAKNRLLSDEVPVDSGLEEPITRGSLIALTVQLE